MEIADREQCKPVMEVRRDGGCPKGPIQPDFSPREKSPRVWRRQTQLALDSEQRSRCPFLRQRMLPDSDHSPSLLPKQPVDEPIAPLIGGDFRARRKFTP